MLLPVKVVTSRWEPREATVSSPPPLISRVKRTQRVQWMQRFLSMTILAPRSS